MFRSSIIPVIVVLGTISQEAFARFNLPTVNFFKKHIVTDSPSSPVVGSAPRIGDGQFSFVEEESFPFVMDTPVSWYESIKDTLPSV